MSMSDPAQPSDEQWTCQTCSWTYDPAEGFYDRESGVQYEPYTPWETLPEEIICPDCGSAKTNFRKVEPPG